MRSLIVVGNWKMYGSLQTNETLVSQLIAEVPREHQHRCVLCVPFPFLGQVGKLTAGSQFVLGAQNVSDVLEGAHTGEVSARMLKDLGCQYVIIGHSERRRDNFENDMLVAKKIDVSVSQGLTPIVCLGESLEEREQGKTEDVVQSQLDGIITEIGTSKISSCVFAYEPIWAIGTGKNADPSTAQEVHHYIRSYLEGIDVSLANSVSIVYGGSVKGSNAKDLFSMPDIDGGLVGGASLSGPEFAKIVMAVEK